MFSGFVCALFGFRAHEFPAELGKTSDILRLPKFVLVPLV